MFYVETIREKEGDIAFQKVTFDSPPKISNMERAVYTNPEHATDIHDFGYVICKLTPKQLHAVDLSIAIPQREREAQIIDQCVYPFLGFSYGMYGPMNNMNSFDALLNNNCPAFSDFEYYFECKFSKSKNK